MRTGFQHDCINRCQSISNANIIFKEVVGESETFYVSDASIGDHHLTIYLYSDEAEYKIDDQWYIFEMPDYKSEDELVDAFINSLKDKIARA